MDFLTLSHTHHLLPFAWRLHREGVKSAHASWRPRAERCWASEALPSPLPPGSSRATAADALGPWVERARTGEVGILWEHPRWEPFVPDSIPHQWGTVPPAGTLGLVRIGGWAGPDALVAPHLLFASLGAWHGGLGPWVEGGMVLVRLPRVPTILEVAWKALEEEAGLTGHRGLAQASISLPGGTVEITGTALGWHGLHPHAFLTALSESVTLHGLLGGATPTLGSRFSAVIPITVPPWPIDCNVLPTQHPVQGLSEEEMGHLFWHDVTVDEGSRELKVSGVDGMVGVARGTGNSLLLAKIRALAVANKVAIPEKQVRVDVGAGVEETLAQMEALGIEVLD